MSNDSVTGTLCAEGAARQPPKHDCHVCKNWQILHHCCSLL